jgi:hypothetical protein
MVRHEAALVQLLERAAAKHDEALIAVKLSRFTREGLTW